MFSYPNQKCLDKDGMSGFKLDWSFEYVPPVECPKFAQIGFLETSSWAHAKMVDLSDGLDWVLQRHGNGMRNLLNYSKTR